MKRQDADRLIEGGTLTWGYLKTLLRSEMGAPWRPAVVNKGMSHEQAVDILAAAIDRREDGGIVAGPRSETPNQDTLIARNILRECS